MMLGAKVFTEPAQVFMRLLPRIRRGNMKALQKAAASIRLTARRSIRERKNKRLHSRPGSPPFTHPTTIGFATRPLRESIVYSVDRDAVIIGPRFAILKKIGQIHEFGGTYFVKGRNRRFPKRPFMGPALRKNLDKIPKAFKGSIRL